MNVLESNDLKVVLKLKKNLCPSGGWLTQACTGTDQCSSYR